LIAQIDQRASQWIKPGDKADFALSMYPGKMFQVEVVDVVWGTDRAQLAPTGILPREEQIQTSDIFISNYVQ